MEKNIDLKKREKILQLGKGAVGLFALLFLGSLGKSFEKRAEKPKVIKKVIVKKVEAVWG